MVIKQQIYTIFRTFRCSFLTPKGFSDSTSYYYLQYSKMAVLHILSCTALILSWHTITEAISCLNRHYCDTKEAKYRAFSALADTYLNSTDHVIRSMPMKDQLGCKRECVRISGCQSSNHFQLINSSAMMCDLIAGNRWSNASKLIPRKNSTHFFIQVCKNTFIPAWLG